MEHSPAIPTDLRHAHDPIRPGREEEHALAARARRHDPEAIDALVRAHLALVMHLAKRYRDRGVPLDDLVGQGCVGLLRAIQRFDPSHGTRFSTYACFWIRKAILDALAEHPRTVHLPRYARERGKAFPREVSLDHAPEGGGSAPLAARLRDGRRRPALDLLVDRQERARLRRFVLELAPREQAVLAFRYGLLGAPAATLGDVGRAFGLSKERIRQIESSALGRLRRRLE